MQGLRAQSDSFLAAIWLECYVLLHYIEHGAVQPLLDRISVLPRENLGLVCFRVELSIMGAWKSLCKALEHIRLACWPLYDWNATFCYTLLSEQGAHRVHFGAR